MLAGNVDGGDRSYLSTCKVLNVHLDGGQQVVHAETLFNRWRKERGQSLPSWDGGGYLGWNPAANITQREMLEDVWRLLFQPSPGVQREIFDQMRDLGILHEKFNAVQVRAKDPRLIPSDTIQESTKLDMLETTTSLPNYIYILNTDTIMRLRAFKKYRMRQNYQSISLQILSLESHTTSIQLQPFAYLPSTKEIHCTLTVIVTKVETLKTFIKRLLTFISCKRQAVTATQVALDYFLSG